MTAVTEAEFLQRFDRHLERQAKLLEEIREDVRLGRREVEISSKEADTNHKQVLAGIHQQRDVTRSMIAEIREQTKSLRDMRHQIQANTRAVLHVLDRLEGTGSA